MNEANADQIARLRAGLEVSSAHAAEPLLYEHWVGQERWPLVTVALALMVGVAPQAWSDYLSRHALHAPAAELRARLMRDLGVMIDGSVSALSASCGRASL